MIQQTTMVLVIDDDPSTLELFDLIEELLTNCQILTSVNFENAKLFLEQHRIDIVILDIVLQQTTGYEICKILQAHPHTKNAYYILMSGERNQLIDRIRVYNHCVQDFILKPFDLQEISLMLASKIDYLTRFKHEKQIPSEKTQNKSLSVGDFELDSKLKIVLLNSKIIELTSMEYNLIAYLLEFPETVFTAEQLLEKIGGLTHPAYKTIDSNVRYLIYRLRQKIEKDPSHPLYLVTARNKGYIFYPAATYSRTLIAQ